MSPETDARIVIDRKLRESGWTLEGSDKNVLTEQHSQAGRADYLLLDRNHRNLAVIEAKNDDIDPYIAKEQSRGYAQAKGCRYIFLANSEKIYFWDLSEGDAYLIERFISPQDLQRRTDLKALRKPLSQIPHNKEIADRSYQMEASEIIARDFDTKGKRAFLLEMATGTGKTRLATALIDRFLKARQAERVLFIVDRIELARQAIGVFQQMFQDKYKCAYYKPGRHGEWGGATIVVATIQSLNIHYKEDFTPGYFDLVFNDECHRSIYGELPRQVVEYFQATRIGLTATPKDFLKNIDVEKLADDNPKALEIRMLRDTYKHFGCEIGTPTFRYTIQNGVRDKWLVAPKINRCLSLITSEAVSKEGWNVEIDSEDYTFYISQLEKRVLVPKRNELLCRQFLENALKAPDGSIGKTIVFAVSRNHAIELTQILNSMATESNGKFAQVIISGVRDASSLAKDFRREEHYWPRVAVTVDMLSTGYDCPEILNLVLARPVASPTTYIQIKGRGTRPFTFKDGTKKTHFVIHDFCEVAKYFEEEYDYESPLPVTVGKGIIIEPPEPPITPREKKTYLGPDETVFKEWIEIGPEGEKVDRMAYQNKWKEKIMQVAKEKPELVEAAKTNNFPDELMEYLNTSVLNVPKEYFNESNLAKVYRIFASIADYIRAALGIEDLPKPEEQLNELIDSLTIEHDLNLEQIRLLRILVKQLSGSPQYAREFVAGNYSFLNNPPFTGYGGVSAYVSILGDNAKEIFDKIRLSNSLKLVLN
jgi:type I restriction enzyme R subunit